MTILERIKKITDNERITITALEKKIGASKGVLSRALNRNTDIQSKWLALIVENFQLYDPFWLLTGKGEMLRNPAAEKKQPLSIENCEECPACKEKERLIKALEDQVNTLKNDKEILNNIIKTIAPVAESRKRDSA